MSPLNPLKIGTRASRLALAQATQVQQALESAHPGLRCELVTIQTSGDKLSSAAQAGAIKGLFVKEIEAALLSGQVDLAVHSAKDLETDLPENLMIGAVLKREDPRDAWVAVSQTNFKEISSETKVGISSLRREAQLKRLRRDLEVTPIRGNVETRLKKLDSGQYGALVLAAAGLIRLGLQERISAYFEPSDFLPAPAQGALAIEIRADRPEVVEKIEVLNDSASRSEIEAERSFLRALGGSCRVPVGALAQVQEENLTLQGVVLSPDGLKQVRKEIAGPRALAEKLGKDLASHVRAEGADRLLYGAWADKGQEA